MCKLCLLKLGNYRTEAIRGWNLNDITLVWYELEQHTSNPNCLDLETELLLFFFFVFNSDSNILIEFVVVVAGSSRQWFKQWCRFPFWTSGVNVVWRGTTWAGSIPPQIHDGAGRMGVGPLLQSDMFQGQDGHIKLLQEGTERSSSFYFIIMASPKLNRKLVQVGIKLATYWTNISIPEGTCWRFIARIL